MAENENEMNAAPSEQDEPLHAALEPAPAKKPERAAELRPRREFVVQHRVLHGHPGLYNNEVREFLTGEVFPDAGVPEEQIVAMRKSGALKLREELEEADAIARRRQQLEAENAALLARQAELEEMVKSLQAGQAPAAPSASRKR